jgi:hypothetical protein
MDDKSINLWRQINASCQAQRRLRNTPPKERAEPEERVSAA